MKDVFDNEISEEVPASQGEPEVQQVEQPEAVAHQAEPQVAAPPAANTSGQVPLQALEAERTKRREWRDKWNESQGELKVLREERQRYLQGGQQPQEQQQFQDPAQRFAYEAIERAENSRFDMSEMLAREKYGDEVVTNAFQHVTDVNDPAVWTKIKSSKNPWAEVVKESKRLEILGQMGDDPLTYEQKLKEKWLAETNPAPATTAPKAPLPASLAGARSSATRSAPGFTGPTPINDLFG